jgi:hypothetical protein
MKEQVMRSVTFRFVGDSIVVLTTAGMALACASLVACESRASTDEQVMATSQPAQIAINPLAGMEPRPPFDETRITPTETVGANDDRVPGRSTETVSSGQ